MRKTLSTSIIAALACITVLAGPAYAEQFNASDLPEEFLFTSGAGGWMTKMQINDDWSFEGKYTDSEMGDVGEGYPDGSVFICTFSGTFSEPEVINSYSLSLEKDSYTQKEKVGEEYIDKNIRYIGSDPYGLEGDDFILYLPGTPFSEFSEDCRIWFIMPLNGTEPDVLPNGFYVLYNVEKDTAFFGESDDFKIPVR